MLEPLLQKAGSPGATATRPRSVGARGRSAAVAAEFRNWWRITTERSFLQSRISRRASWKVVLPLLSLAFLLVDSLGAVVRNEDISFALSDLLITVACFAYSRSSISSDNLLLDSAFGLLAGYLGIAFALTASAHTSEDCEGAKAMVPLDFPISMIFLSFAGVHSLVILWLLALCGVCCAARAVPLESLLCSIVISVGVVWVEYIIATLYNEWRAQLGCNHKLLEAATDGFGIVDCASGDILQASPKMAETLGKGSVDLVGCELKALVDECDHGVLTSRFLGVQGGKEPEKVMVTCSSQLWEIDVRLVPYQLQGSRIAFCVQKMGEARQREALAQQVHYRGHAGASASRNGCVHGAADSFNFTRPVGRGLGTLSLSNWTVSCDGDDADAGASQAPARESDATDNQSVPAACAAALPTCADSAAVAVRETAKMGAAVPTTAAASETETEPGSKPGAGTGTGRARGPPPPAREEPEEGAGGQGTTSVKKQVETRTLGVQSDDSEQSPKKRTPPAPLTASSASKHAQFKALRKKRLAKACRAVVTEGEPRFKAFAPTPKSTRGNFLCQLARSCNLKGTGCCAKHVAWMALQTLITEELLSPCGYMPFCSDWQCPECGALNDFDADDDEDEQQQEQACAVCGGLVQPILPTLAMPQVQSPLASGQSRDKLVDSTSADNASAGDGCNT